jgi:ankyrin repeat protein
MISRLYSLSLRVISSNIQGDITQQLKIVHSLDVDANSKKNIIEELEKLHIQDFIDSDIESKGSYFEYYIYNKKIETIKIILKYYPKLVDIPNTSYFGQTPLYNASSCSNYELVQLLLEYGADPNIQDLEDNESALMNSAYHNDVEVADLLLQYSANCDLQNRFNETALHIACWRGHLNIVKLLLKYNANPFMKSSFIKNNTPLKLAISKGFKPIVEILTKYEAYEDYEDDKNK